MAGSAKWKCVTPFTSLDGSEPEGLSLSKLIAGVPAWWAEQRRGFGGHP